MDQELVMSRLRKAGEELATTFALYGPGPQTKAKWNSAWSALFDSDPLFRGAAEELANEIEIMSILLNGTDSKSQGKILDYISAKSAGLSLADYLKTGRALIIVTRNSPFDKEYYDYFLAVKISQCPEKAIYEILTFHFIKYFQSDRPAFRNFLEYAVLKDHISLLDKEKVKIIQDFCDDYLTSEKKTSALSARQQAIILYINVHSHEQANLVPKVKKLKEHAKSLRIGAPSFVQIYYAVEKDFLNRKLSLAKEITSIYHLLRGPSIEVANQFLRELNQLSAQPR